MTPENELPRSGCVQYATWEERRAIKIDPERMKQLGRTAVYVAGGKSKV